MLRKILMGSFSLFAFFALAGAALTFTDSASAQVVEDGSAEVQQEQPEREGRQRGQRSNRNILSNEEKAQVIANQLGITVEDVQAAREEGTSTEELAIANGSTLQAVETAIFNAKVTRVSELVESGDLTEEEGIAIVEKLELAQIKSDIIDDDALEQAAANAIGVTVAEVEEAKEARTYSELLEENGVTREEVQAAVEAAKNQMIDDAVANGDITEAQAEQLREGRSDNKGRGDNGRSGRNGRGGNGNGGADDVEAGQVDA